MTLCMKQEKMLGLRRQYFDQLADRYNAGQIQTEPVVVNFFCPLMYMKATENRKNWRKVGKNRTLLYFCQFFPFFWEVGGFLPCRPTRSQGLALKLGLTEVSRALRARNREKI